MIYLLAYPRSGSSWVRYILSYLTESPCVQPQGHCEMDYLCKEWYKKTYNIIKFHYPNDIGYSIDTSKGNKLAYLRRNPAENILSFLFSKININNKNINVREIKQKTEKMIKYKFNYIRQYLVQYKKNEDFFDKWKHESLILNYDLLMKFPEDEINTWKKFFNIEQDRINSFLKDYKYHRERVFAHKKKPDDPFHVNTDGDIYFFKKLIDVNLYAKVERLINK